LSHFDYGPNKILAKYGKYLNNTKQQQYPNLHQNQNTNHQHHQIPHQHPNHHNLSRATRITGYSSSQDSGRDSGRDSSVREVMSSSSNPNNASSEDENINKRQPQQQQQQDEEDNFSTTRNNGGGRGGGPRGGVIEDNGNAGHISAATSFDSDSALTEGRHCNLFSEKQGSLCSRYDGNLQHHPNQPPLAHAKQLRINSSNRMANDGGALHKTSIAAISGGGGTSGSGSGLGYLDKSGMEATTLGSRTSLHHNIYTNDTYESRYVNEQHSQHLSHLPNHHHHHHQNTSISASSTFLLDDGSELEMDAEIAGGQQKTYLVPLDIPTPPPQPHMPHGRATTTQTSMCQCDTAVANNGSALCHHQQHFQQVAQHRATTHQHQHTVTPNTPNRMPSSSSTQLHQVSMMEIPLANGLSHHHQPQHPHHRHHHSSVAGSLLNYKLHDPQLQQFTTGSPHYQHDDQLDFGHHPHPQHHHKLPLQKSFSKLQLHQKQQQLQNLVFPQLSPYHSGSERNSSSAFHQMDGKNYAKKKTTQQQQHGTWYGISLKNRHSNCNKPTFPVYVTRLNNDHHHYRHHHRHLTCHFEFDDKLDEVDDDYDHNSNNNIHDEFLYDHDDIFYDYVDKKPHFCCFCCLTKVDGFVNVVQTKIL
ncbi:LIM domain-containing protein A-like, partial [Musca vetustissima]|uniref:LIM domain-containing protein A-like n=1 Tax=Musca vetustissima TaxID=27455 RepID=UPI002AB6B4F3